MAIQRSPCALVARGQKEVTEGAALDADEEPVDLEEGGEDGEGGPLPAFRRGGAVPVEASLIEVPMVEPRERKAPGRAAQNTESGGLAGSHQRVARVAAHMSRPADARDEPGRARWNGDGEHSSRSDDTGDLGEGAA